jgi:hypothetical protein
MSQEIPKAEIPRRLSLCISPKADDLLRQNHNRRRGDLSKYIEGLILKDNEQHIPEVTQTSQ